MTRAALLLAAIAVSCASVPVPQLGLVREAAGACGCPATVDPWPIYQPPIGTTSPGSIGWPAAYLESLSPPTGEWCYQGDLTDWVCQGVFTTRCLGQWVAVRRIPLTAPERWVVISDEGENCLPCFERGCMETIFRDGFNSGNTRRWDRRHPP